jgi:N-acetylmuramoyl-L-alanine amidase
VTKLAIAPHPSPNHGARKGGPVDILLLHYTGMPDAERALAWLCDAESKVSAHYFVFEDGRVLSLVPEARRAWHAGAARWGDATDINSRSIGIEIANPGHPGGLPDFPEAQIEALIALCRDIVGRNPIPPHRVLAHSDVAPGRKLDPGERFPWRRLATADVGHWAEPQPIADGRFFQLGDNGEPIEALQALLALYGYGIDVTGVFDQRTEDVVAAFQRHFRPARVDGVADRSTIETLRKLLEALP